jgi:acetolactate synthase-1/2/3 large subunit
MTAPAPVTRTLTGAHALLEALEGRGVRHLFGIPGHGAYPIFDALNDVPAIRPIVGRNEQGNTFSALGYAWATGETAVATSVPAAGLLNAATPLAEATATQERILFLLEHDRVHADVLRSIAAYHRIVEDAAQIAPATVDLLDALETGRPGTAVLEVPNRLLNGPCEAPPRAPAQPRPRATVDQGTVGEAASFLAGSGRVAIVAGASALAGDSADSIRRIAEALGAPVFTDGLARGIPPDDHPLAMGHTWTPGGPGERFLDGCDALLIVGAPIAAGQNSSTWDNRMVAGLRPQERLAQQLVLVDWDDRDQAALPARARLRGHVPSLLAALADALPANGPRRPPDASGLPDTRALARRYAQERIPDGLPFLDALSSALSPDATLLTDSLVAFWLDRLHAVSAPRRLRFPWGTGTLGFGLPAAVGIALARPGKEVVAVMGDGAALYNLQELATLRMYGLKATLVVLNDDSFSAIKHNMQATFGRSTVWQLVNPDFVALATAFGIRARRVETPDALAAAIVDARTAEGSTLIEVPLEMLPPSALFDFRFGAPPTPEAR